MGQRVRTFFSKVNIQPEVASHSTELNVIKRNYIFEDSIKDETSSNNDRRGHILIECIKNTTAAKELER